MTQPSSENERPPQPGDFVNAQVVGQDVTRQGVYLYSERGNKIRVLGESGTFYTCQLPAAIIPDENIFNPDTLRFIQETRLALP